MQYVRNFVNTTVTATLYTVIESCKKAQLDPKSYILMAVRKKIEEKKEVPTPLKYAKKLRDFLLMEESIVLTYFFIDA